MKGYGKSMNTRNLAGEEAAYDANFAKENILLSTNNT